MPRHLTARGRLSLLLTGLVLVAGLVITALTYLLTRHHLGRRATYTRFTAGTATCPPFPLSPSRPSRPVTAWWS
ncbi:hypothetical protein [Streptomyces sp. RFCAC02]|uniref:hypothetical protein n=1 Tax=Streptomyces sp. RFCAC02 TaxID=2499143 RepID=UPI0019D29FF3|nr:hypothetical protein [Streptomyces sp. RFCAC02]